ncbi:filamentous hemagglutinin N-terminal domain-containing protein [Pseudomonas silvicola]|nr:filamentous hemagglutinin N-terminal domain-containing protein [Pseudomonas silvicola]
MDARHLAFLARQPSAALAPRDRFWGMPKRALAFLLANVMLWQPLWAQADGIVVSGQGTTLGTAGNGVPVVNIAAPNAAGLSHNQFQDYNVGSQGVILNNATGRTQATQLGGIVLGNANLNGKAATTILNEVTGNNRSQLKGYTEVAGQAARVIVANPYGITCNGCGFINTPRATLTTGKPVLDGSGRLDRFQVDGGDIAIEGAGLDAANIDQFELITRTAQINARLYAKNLTVVAGRNDVNADTLQATARADDGSQKPELAIDSAALGGMYVGAVKLVGTEKGVGVRLAGDLAASAGDVQIDANGKLTMANVSANGAVVAKASGIDAQGAVYAGTRAELRSSADLTNEHSISARDSVTLSADGKLSNSGVIEAGVNADNSRNAQGDVTLQAADISNSASVIASRTLAATGTHTLRNDNGVVQGHDVTLTTAQLTNNGSGARLRGENSLNLNTPAIANLGGLIRFGGGQNVDLNLASLDNRAGRLELVGGQFKVVAANFDNRDGSLLADTLDLDTPQLDNRRGVLIASVGSASVKVTTLLDNRQGTLQAATRLDVSGGEQRNSAGKLLGDVISVTADSFDNSAGGLISAGQGDLALALTGDFNNQNGSAQAQQALSIKAGAVDNRTGTLSADSVNVTADSLDNSADGLVSASQGAIDLNLARQFNNQAGRALAKTLFSLQASDLDNRGGKLQGQALVFRTPAATVDNRGGSLLFDTLNIAAGKLDNRDAGLIATGIGGATLTLTGLDNSGGRIQGDGSLLISAATLDNHAGAISGQAVTLTTGALNNSAKGAILGNGGTVRLTINGVLNNATGTIDAANQRLLLTSFTQLDNRNGSLGGNRVDISGTQLDNREGGQILAGVDGLQITAATVLNQQGLLYAKGGAVTLDLADGTLQNQGGSVVADSLDVTAGHLDNSADDSRAGMLSSIVGALKLKVAQLTNRAGKLFAKGDLSLDGQQLTNASGGEISGASLAIDLGGQLGNQGLIEALGGLSINAASLDNSGRISGLGGGRSQFTIGGALVNSGTLKFNSDVFSLTAGSLDGSLGSISGTGSSDWHLGTASSVGRAQFDGTFAVTSGGALTVLAGDRLATTDSLILNVGSLDNLGELVSNLDMTLLTSGDQANRGLLSSQGNLRVNARDFSQVGGRLASAGNTILTLTGDLANGGRLIAGNDLTISATHITNDGTLGGQGNVSLNARQTISNNADTLLFAGGDLALRADRFINTYGDLYNQGNLSFAAYDGGRASAFSNLSGSVQSLGRIDLNAVSIENAKAQFELDQAVVSGTLEWKCGQHCGGHDSFKRGVITITKALEESVLLDSPMARLIAGGNMTLNASDVQNRYSLLAANGDLTLNADTLLNQGASSRSGSQVIVIATPQRISTGYWDQMQYVDVPAFNAAVAAGHFDESRFNELIARSSDSRFQQQSDVTTWTPDSTHNYTSTIQSGGTATLNVTQSVQNGTLLEQTLAQLTGTLDNEATQKVGAVVLQLSPERSADTPVAAKDVQRVERIDTDGTVHVSFTPVDFTGVPFAAVDPTASTSFRLPQGEYGLFVPSQNPQSHYLIETNPNLTDPSRFMSSDYLLGQLGFSADEAARRLGDGRYESRLISDAVVAQTGQRFLAASLTSDYDQYRYLMDNALASKDALNLSVGVGLSAQQVAALTHDIVWLENRVIDGQNVLVPVLYLAQADERNLNGGSLIQGRNLSLMAGSDLVNVGTLRASEDLTATAGGSLYNGGVVEANERLSLLARDSIRNALAGDIRASQVSLQTLKGDIVNDRTAIAVNDGAGMRTLTDAGARIAAGETLNVTAGQDITNHGAMSAGGDANLSAARDINLVAVQDVSEKHEFHNGGHDSSVTSDVKNLAGTVSAGGSVHLNAGQDVNVIASDVKAGTDISIVAARDLNAAANGDVHNVESRSKDGKQRIKEQNDSTTQRAATFTAGNDFTSGAGRDTTLVASKITAGHEAYLYSGDQTQLLAAQDSTHTLYDMKEKGSWGAKKMQRDEVTQQTNVGTEIKTGGDLTIESGGDQRYQVAKLESGKDITLASGGAITFEGVKDLHDESHTKSKSDLSWFSAKGEGHTDETLRQSALVAQGQLAIKAVDGLHIDIKQIDQNTVSQTIDAMVKADPQLAWLKQAEQRGDVNWQQVKELHESFKYNNSGMGQGAMLAVIIVVSALTAGAASALAASAGSTVGAGATMAAGYTTAAGVVVPAGLGNVIATAALTSMASTGAVSLINNKGNVGTALTDTFSSDGVKQAVIAGASAGFINYAGGHWFGAQTDPITNKVTGPSVVPHLTDPAAIARFGAIQLAGGVVRGGLSQALGQGKFSDAMLSSVFDMLQATVFTNVGDLGDTLQLPDSGLGKTAIHALAGGLLAEAMGGDFKTGALAAGANEALIETLDSLPFLQGADQAEHDRLVNAASKLVGLVAAAGAGGDVALGSEIAGNAQSYNRKLHAKEEEKLAQAATTLDETVGKSRTGFSWDMLLTLVAGGDIDQRDNARLTAIMAQYGDGNPEGVALADDLAKARSVVQDLQNAKVLLTWEDGKPVIADGAVVYEFSATPEQFKDSALFNSANTTTYDPPGGVGVVPDKWVEQYGESVATKKLREIGAISNDADLNADQWQALERYATGGVDTSTVDLDVLLAVVPGASAAKGGVRAVLQALAEARAAGASAKSAAQVELGSAKAVAEARAGEASATGTAGEVAGTGARNPLLDDAIPRGGDRLVVNQGAVPTCGHNSCGMVLNTLGKEVDVGTLIRKLPPSEKGIFAQDVASLMKSEGVPASAFGNRNVADLARYTSSGTPVVVRVVDGAGNSGFSHFVVVDGITTRNGISVVAIRDPHGKQYFSPITTFERNFSGEVVVPRSALK